MRTFVADKEEHRVLDTRLKQEGTLFLSTTIEIRGNYLKGAVPVRVIHVARFVPDKKFWDNDDRHPDEEPYSVSYHCLLYTSPSPRDRG